MKRKEVTRICGGYNSVNNNNYSSENNLSNTNNANNNYYYCNSNSIYSKYSAIFS